MSRRPALVSGALRLAAAGLGTAAVVMWSGAGRVPSEAAVEITAEDTHRATSTADAWLLRANGWVVRVDREPANETPTVQTVRLPAQEQTLISPFDPIIQRHADAEGFDWRLIAAVIAEESGFNPTSRSPRGAYGLMQVRGIAARAVGEKRYRTPDDNVRTGVRYLQYLREMFSRASLRDRRRLMLAAYHMGPSHVRDAQKLARHYGYDPYRWEGSMDRVLPLLEEPDIHATLTYGYARGRLTVDYVERVLERFHQYQRTTAGQPLPDAAQAERQDSALAG